MAQVLTNKLWTDLNRINREDNKAVSSNYAPTKIKRLVTETAWRSSNLSVRTCYMVYGQGRTSEKHNVAIAKTNRGAFVLDNHHKNAVPYGELPYHWV